MLFHWPFCGKIDWDWMKEEKENKLRGLGLELRTSTLVIHRAVHKILNSFQHFKAGQLLNTYL